MIKKRHQLQNPIIDLPKTIHVCKYANNNLTNKMINQKVKEFETFFVRKKERLKRVPFIINTIKQHGIQILKVYDLSKA